MKVKRILGAELAIGDKVVFGHLEYPVTNIQSGQTSRVVTLAQYDDEPFDIVVYNAETIDVVG